jgi:hypothetical protein
MGERADTGNPAPLHSGKTRTSFLFSNSALDKLSGTKAAGLPADYVEFLLMIFGFLREGYNGAINNNVAQIIGRSPRGLQQYTQNYKSAWK